jgi:hypothetical protein
MNPVGNEPAGFSSGIGRDGHVYIIRKDLIKLIIYRVLEACLCKKPAICRDAGLTLVLSHLVFGE